MPTSSLKRTAFEVAGLIVTAGALAIGLLYLAHYLVEDFVAPQLPLTREELLDSFELTLTINLTVAAVGILLWYLVTKLSGVTRVSDAGKRPTWAVLLVAVLIVSTLMAFLVFVQPAQGGWIAYGLLVLAPLILFYVPTAVFTPVSFKYAPVGARAVRPQWL